MKKITVNGITTIALATVINIIGAYIALVLHLPIYLDSIGTIFTGAILGPVYGLIPSLLSGIVSQLTSDPYAIYFAPAGMVVGMMAGFMFRTSLMKKWKIFIGTLFMTIPGTLLSATIAAMLFGGVTSSGSSMLVFLLRKLGMSMIASVYSVQVITGYADHLVAVILVISVLAAMPKSLIHSIKGDWNGQI